MPESRPIAETPALTAEECRREMLRTFDAYCKAHGRPPVWGMRSEVFELVCGRSEHEEGHAATSR